MGAAAVSGTRTAPGLAVELDGVDGTSAAAACPDRAAVDVLEHEPPSVSVPSMTRRTVGHQLCLPAQFLVELRRVIDHQHLIPNLGGTGAHYDEAGGRNAGAPRLLLERD